jgi:nitrogen fixation NifU-like protein
MGTYTFGSHAMASNVQGQTPSEKADSIAEGRPSAAEDTFFGRMSDPSGSAFVRGACGDEMEFYLTIQDGVISEVKYYTEGCADTRRYGRAAAMAAQGKGLLDALGINPRQILGDELSLAEGSRHCAILAVITLYRAIAEYLMQP